MFQFVVLSLVLTLGTTEKKLALLYRKPAANALTLLYNWQKLLFLCSSIFKFSPSQVDSNNLFPVQYLQRWACSWVFMFCARKHSYKYVLFTIIKTTALVVGNWLEPRKKIWAQGKLIILVHLHTLWKNNSSSICGHPYIRARTSMYIYTQLKVRHAIILPELGFLIYSAFLVSNGKK